MSPRCLRTAIVLLVALAFALGSVSSATAAGLGKGAVRKIAAAVVKKKAPSLSVAHATTADSALKATNATNADNALKLGGLTAAQLGVRPIVFTVPSGPHVSGKTFALNGVPAGSYLLSLHGIVSTTTESFAECFIQNETQDEYVLLVNATGGPSRVPVMNGVGYDTVNAGDKLTFSCSTAANWSPSDPMHVIFTPTASVVPGTMTVVKGTG